ncbi:MAG: response regulator [Alphaproteobacteria bacterium]|nr:response regulator [Alphaproteobacteria bacterium]MBU1512536.1 response regulator [Alphaproteobacteria bacterium]MBU2092875.1 response regulator [Alphaproteobacteria bacterium]MBU2150886.1 response regulator [Alphaproteobacteria bacterium]MBU2307903.1 response regulator [Alphaproteobacteria bacterium]
MTLLFDIAPHIPPVSPNTAGAEVYARFQDEADTLAIAVVDDDGRPVGLLERNAFLVLMAAQHGYALWARRPVSHLMKRDPVVIDGDVTLEEFVGSVLAERPSELLHGFIVTCAGRYAGVGTTLALLQASAAATASHAETMSRLAWEASEALQTKGRFLAVMSHEIRTPLNGVLAVAEILKRKSAQPDLSPFIDTILESGGALLRLLNDALDLSRAEAAGLGLDEAPLPVAKILEDTGLWTAQAELKGLEVRVTYDGPADLWVLADAVRLRQVLNNLVGNALKFTSQGQVEVRLSASMDGDYVRLAGEIADTGPGIPHDRLEAVFAPFQQTDEGMRQGGAGLGLAVCRQIVERMNGTIAARPRDGGAVLTFDIPLHRLPAPAAEAPVQTAVESTGQAVHVLIVDDNATNRMVAQTLCEMFGCSSEAVDNGEDAVAAVTTGRFDLVLMDIKMPGIDGVEATRRIRSGGGPASQAPILALTANADPSDAAFYRLCGMNGVVEKPIKPERLLAAMSAVLQVDRGVAEACAA